MIILGTNSVKDTGYDVANSCRFNAGDSDNMHKTPGSASNRRKFTFSCWIKKGDITPSADTCLFSGDNSDDNARPDDIRIKDTGKLQVAFRNTNDGVVSTKRVLRDPSAWMNIVVSIDTEQSTASNRVKIYINGVQETSLEGDGSGDPTYPSEDHDCTGFGRDTKITVGARSMDTPDKFFDGYLAEVVYIDGLQLAPTSFGEFDEDSPTIWKPIDVSELTFGTNGFYLDFEASDNLGNDANGGTDLTEVNLAATDSATDSPTNNFATLNPTDNYYAGATLSEGNLLQVSGTFSGDSTGQLAPVHSTIGVSSGKWYSEVKFVSTTTHDYGRSGVTSNQSGPADATASLGYFSGSYGYFFNSGDIYNGNGDTATSPTYGSSVDVGDIIGMYLDLDNNKLYFADNGTLVSSTGISITAAASTNLGSYFFGLTDQSRAAATFGWNFGGCSAFTVSSGNTDVNGYGNFEYDPSSGTFDGASKNFLALCTKNLAEHG